MPAPGAVRRRPRATPAAVDKRERLKDLLRQKLLEPRSAPVSFAQERLWLLDRLGPGSTVYSETGAIRIEGPLDPSLCADALNALVRRHEALRTTFSMVGNRPVQRIAPVLTLDVPILDRSEVGLHERDEVIRHLAAEQTRVPFDLARGPLLRARLVRFGNADHGLIITLHHIIADGWSIGILLFELQTLARSPQARLEDLPLQYADFARWQREHLSGRRLAAHLTYWRRQLEGLPILNLPSDRPRPPSFSGRGTRLPFRVSRALAESLRELGRGEGATLYMTLLAAFQCLLARHADQVDVVLGSPVAGRDRPETASLVGFFVNMLVLRTDLSGDPTFRETIRRARAVCLDAHDHDEVPFAKLVAELQPERSLNRLPLFQVAFVLQKDILDQLTVPEFRVRRLEVDGGISKFDLTLFLWEGTEGLEGYFEYGTDLFEAETIESMAARFRTMLEGAVADPDTRLSELPVLAPDERRRVLVEWNEPRTAHVVETCIHERFERQVERAGDAVAVVAEHETLTYRELNLRANRLAHRLGGLGVEAETPVGLLFDRSSDAVVAMLSVLKAGGVYVPLEPRQPRSRIEGLVRDAGLRVVVAQRALIGSLPDDVVAVCLDEEPVRSREPEENPRLRTVPGNLAYVIYTSGSTGRPKGVQVTHANLLRLFDATESRYRFDARDVWTLFHSYAFDFSVWEIWGALLHGGRLVVVPYWSSRAPAEMLRLVGREGVTVLNQTPSAFRTLVQADREAGTDFLSSLRLVVLGGEALEPGSLRGWFERRGDERPQIVNMYGITETTVHVTYRALRSADAIGGVGSVIGRPIGDLDVYVLDRDGGLVPVGVVGELYVGGCGLARGYVGRGDWTAERFVPDGFGVEVGGRLYRTGDRVRWMRSGELEFLGRMDEQVKVRGHRIEPGEVEAALELLAGVERAVVVSRAGSDGLVRLVGYVVGDAAVTELRAGLLERLPEHMVPSVFVRLSSLPLTVNGKLDRQALPDPEESGIERGSSYEAPSTEVERALAGIWESVLGVSRVGSRDNFFELGGDSILSIQVVSRASRVGLRLAPADVFRHQTIAELSRVVGQREEQVAEQGLVLGELERTPIQRWYFSRAQAEWSHYNQSVLLSRAGSLDSGKLERVVRELVLHHDALRLRFERSVDGGWLQRIVGEEGAFGASSRVDLSGLPVGRRAGALEECCSRLQGGLDLAAGPIVRVVSFDLGDGSSRVLWVIHHLAVDGVSWRVLLEDFASGYAQLEGGAERIELGGKTTSYREWSERLTRHASSTEVESELSYWREVTVFGTSEPVRPGALLVADHAEGRNEVGSARRVERSLTEEETRRLLQEVPLAYRMRLEEVLLTALAQELGRRSGEASVVLDLEGHGREEQAVGGVDLSRTVGWFTTLYPVRLPVLEEPGSALKAVKEELRGVPGRGLGYGLLRYVRGATDLETTSEVSFNYLGRLDGAVPEGSGWSVAGEDFGAVQGRGLRSYELEWNGWIRGGCLFMSWTYGGERYERETIESLAEGYVTRLRELSSHCLEQESGGATPSDFPWSGLDQAGVDLVVGRERAIADVYRLSPLQSGMLFHSLYAPRSGVYVEQLSLVVRGAVDGERFRRSWLEAVKRHGVLRTGVVWEGLSEPQQVVWREAELPWLALDWREMEAAERSRRLEELLAEERRRGFDLSRPPLMRMCWIREEDEAWRFVWSHHHVLLDGWSVPLLLQEVLVVYEALGRGVSAELGPVTSYGEYIGWLSRRERTESERYWRGALEGLSAPTPMGMLTSRSAVGAEGEEEEYGERHLDLSESATARLEGWSREQHLTLSTVLQGAWGLLLSRYSGERETLHGTTVSGRTAPLEGIERMLGLFINTVPVRVRVEQEQSVAEWLLRLQETQLEQRAHEHSALWEIQGFSALPRGVGLFESLLVVENYPVDRALGQRFGSLSIAEVQQTERTNYPLTVVALPGKRLGLRVSYAESRIDAAGVERLLGQLCHLLEQIPDAQTVRELHLLTEAERHLLLEEWNRTERVYPRVGGVEELIEAQAHRRGAALALCAGGVERSYAELEANAERLARQLSTLGVGPEVAVGVCLERSVELVECLYAVWKAKGAYVPLDPGYPKARIAYMLDDSKARVVLTRKSLLHKLPETQATILCLDDPTPQDLPELPHRPTHPEQLAYILYTSGSTGQPKGVAVPHHALANLCFWHQVEYRLTPEDRASQVASQAFDASVWEIWPYLAVGASVHVVDDETRSSPARLTAWLDSRAITLCFLPTPVAESVLDESWPRTSALRALLTGGDRLRLRPGPLPFRLINHYGPTENTVVATSTTVEPGQGAPPIGIPIGNVRVYVLDRDGGLVPVGVVGELYVGGCGLARGYVGRGDWTAERFVPDGFGVEVGGRLYRTGDRVRWMRSGELEFLGRMDEQVKVRGHRIEPGEVEAALELLAGVERAVVVSRAGSDGLVRLVGYVVGDAAVTELRAGLLERLPEHMVPSVFVRLSSLPLTVNGKLDRQALPDPEESGIERGSSYEAPSTEVERALAGIWESVLGVSRVGSRDNFFELGGDSILSIQVVSRASRVGLRLAPADVFRHQTIAELSRVVGQREEQVAEQGLVLGELERTPIQRWYFSRAQAEWSHYNQSVLLSRAGSLDSGKLERVVRELVLHHDALRLRFERSVDGGWLQRIVGEEGAFGASSRVDLSGLPVGRRAGALEECCSRLQGGLDLAAGPIVRVVSFDLGDGSSRVLWVIHHLAVDGVSWRVLLEDFASGYAQLEGGAERIELGGKTTSYREWSERLTRHASSTEVESELSYWREVTVFGTSEPVRPGALLVADHAEGRNEVGSARRVERSLTEEETRRLLQEVPLAYRMRLEEVLLTALAQELGRRSGEASVVLDLEGHGREEQAVGGVDLSRTVGWFTTLYPVRLPVLEEPGSALKAVKEELRGVPGRGLGYGLLRYVRGATDLETTSEVSFNYLGRLDGAVPEGSGWSVAGEDFGAVQGRGLRSYELEWNGWIRGGCLFMSWTYGGERYERETIESLAEGYVARLRELSSHCLEQESGGATPSDFPWSGLDQAGVDLVVGRERAIADVYRLSPLQSGMLFHSLYAPRSGVYVEQLSLVVRGAVDGERFRRSWLEAVKRHGVLRTGVVWEGLSEPQQVVWREAELPWLALDWREMEAAERSRRLEELLAEERRRGFDLSRPPLMRMCWIREEDEAWRFVWSHHHVLLDGWSVPLLLQEVLVVYEALGRGVSAELGPVTSYGEYIGWLSRRERTESERYWRGALEGLSAPTPMGMLTSRSAVGAEGEEEEYGERHLDLSESATARLEGWSREQHLTLSTVLQGAWGLLLSRYSGERETLHGTTVSGRTAPLEGIERMLGLFINTVPVRVRVEQEQSVAEWLLRLQETQLEQRAHEHSALWEIQGFSALPRGVGLFESLLVVENYPVDRALGQRFGSLSIAEVQQTERTNYPLTVVALPGKRLGLRMSYAESRIDAAGVERLLGQLCHLLEQIPDAQTVRELHLLTEAERHLLLEEWNRTERVYPRVGGVEELIEAQAHRRGAALALCAGGVERSYAELEANAERLARQLSTLGVGPEVAVGVCLERSVELVECLYAVWKAKGAYVPLDPGYPKARIAYMLDDSKARVVLTRKSLLHKLPETQATILCLDDPTPQDLPELPHRPTHPEQLAYILYTSGSTGQPKGVAVPHHALANLCFWQLETSSVPRGATLLFASPSFDVSVQEIVATLGGGGCLVLIGEDERRDPASLLAALESTRVERMFLPFVALQQLAVAAVERGAPEDLREIVTAGEALTVTPEIESLFGDGKRLALCNQYGPTETHVATAFSLSGRPRDWPRLPPIGHSIANARTYLLDSRFDPVPLGAAGELFLGGAVPARGYHDLAPETAERFLPDPFSARPGARMYRTGDLGRRLASGAIEFLGRIDDQLKIRGFRVEPGEIEAHLATHPDVLAVAVVGRGKSSGERRLVAYVVPRGEEPPAVEDLRAHLEQSLPQYMVPASFAFLPCLPLTPSGKLDRRSLPEPVLAPHAVHVAPESPLEQRLAALWAEVLDLERAGVHDDFFGSGGHSLLATRLVSRIRESEQLEVPLRAVFENPTVAALARWIESRARGAEREAPLRAHARDGDLPLSFSQQRLWFLDRLSQGDATYNMPAAARLDGPLCAEALSQSLDDVVSRHEVLRTTFPSREGTARQHIAPAAPGTLRQVDLGQLAPEARQIELARMLHDEPRSPFDLERGPLVRACLVRLAPEEHVLLLTLHHIVCDGWSIEILVREIAACYRARTHGVAASLSPLPVQYADFAIWQRETLRGERLEAALAYWRDRLAGLPQLELSTDRPRPSVRTGRGASFRFEISEDLSRAVNELAAREGASAFMVLLAAFEVLLAREAGQRDFAIGSPIAGRTRSEIEGLVGFFVNTLVLRADLSGDPTFLELLSRVRETALEAFARQDLPFERLVEELGPQRDLARDPLLQVMFAMANGWPGRVDLSGDLSLTPLPLDAGTSKLDLTLFVSSDPTGLAALFEYSTDLFDAETISSLSRRLVTLLRAITAAPTDRVFDLDLVEGTERASVLAWAEGERGTAPAIPFHEAFESAARRAPDAAALVWNGGRLGYGDLDRRANRLAHRLRAAGVGPESLVALGLEGPDLVVAMLAALKAGGAFLSFDPDGPAERVAFMAHDAGPALLVTDELHATAFAELDLDRVWVDREARIIADYPDVAPDRSDDPSHLAYAIYTSGSTGSPKGALLTHGGLSNLAAEQRRVLDVGPQSTVLQLAPAIYDAAVWEIAMALSTGATLVLARHGERSPGPDLLRLVREHAVTVLTLPPSLLAVLPFEDLPSLTTLVLAGERCPSDLVRRWGSGRRVLNAYGPTESTVCATWAEVEERDGIEPPIGRPLANLSARVLDEHSNLVSVGVGGELCLGGVGLARGYLNAPDRTAERFVPDPFGSPGARLYRTGDRARWLRGGVLEFLGRSDEQIKIHGVRVEPGEVEARLRSHPGVREAAVVARADARGEARLEAYVVVQDERADAESLRRHLAVAIARAAIPSRITVLPELPRSASGKLDRAALAARDAPSELASYAGPRSALERELCEIFGETLGVARVGIHDSFFELGGHSLSAARLAWRVQERLGRPLPLAEFFQSPTIAELARVLDAPGSGPVSSLVPLRGGGSRRPFFCVHGGTGLVLDYLPISRRLAGDRPFYGLQSAGLFGEREPFTTVEEMSTHYLQAIRSVQPRGPYLLGGHSFGGLVAFEMARQIRQQGEGVDLLVLLDASGPRADGNSAASQREPDAIELARVIAPLSGAAGLDLERAICDVPPPERLAWLACWWSERQVGLPALDGLLRVMRANAASAASYAPQTYPGLVRLLRVARNGEDVHGASPCLGWSPYTERPVEVRFVPGDHDSMLSEPHVLDLARQLEIWLDSAT